MVPRSARAKFFTRRMILIPQHDKPEQGKGVWGHLKAKSVHEAYFRTVPAMKR